MAAIDPKCAADPAPENPGKVVEVTSLNVNIRKGNGTQYGRIVILPYGTKLPYVATACKESNAVMQFVPPNFCDLLVLSAPLQQRCNLGAWGHGGLLRNGKKWRFSTPIV